MTPKEKEILDMQEPSTRAALLEPEIDRKLRQLTPIVKESQVTKEDGSVDLAPREITKEEYDAYQALRYQRGAAFEEARTAYLMRMAALGKIHVSLMPQIETNHVMPPEPVKEKAERAFMGRFTFSAIKEKFKEIMDSVFKPSFAELVKERNKGKL